MNIQEAVLKEAEETVKQMTAKVIMKKEANRILSACNLAATTAVAQFYASYVPSIYQRQRTFYDSPRCTLTKVNDMKYHIDIRFSSALGGYHHDPSEYIYEGVMYMGVHGTSEIAVTTPVVEYFENWLKMNFR